MYGYSLVLFFLLVAINIINVHMTRKLEPDSITIEIWLLKLSSLRDCHKRVLKLQSIILI